MGGCLLVGIFVIIWIYFLDTVISPFIEEIPNKTKGIMFGIVLIMSLVFSIVIGVYLKSKQKKVEAERKAARRQDAEEIKTAEGYLQVRAIQEKYTPLQIKTDRIGIPLTIGKELINTEVVEVVRRYEESIAVRQSRYSFVGNELQTILECGGHQTDADKYTYLMQNMERIRALKDECDKILGSKIMLVDEDIELMGEMKLAFESLRSSKICVSDGINVMYFVSAVRPSELDMFRYDNEPVTLFLGQHYFCLFSKVILVFDAVGVFVNAIDPSAMRIDVSRRETEVNICNGESSLNEYVDEDSKCIRRGEEKERWLHMCSDGSRDVKHIDNPWVRWRTDTYEYAVIKFTIAGESVSFEVSSDAVADAFDVFRYKYIRQHNHRKNFLPMFLQLMNRVSDGEDANIKNIIEICALQENENNRFCRIINC